MTTETKRPTNVTVRAWKDEDSPTYIVQVGDGVYEMDAHANRPDGLCQYVGKAEDLAWTVRDRPVSKIPTGIAAKAAQLAVCDALAYCTERLAGLGADHA